jgi:DOPA 4,5-dioxygenase
MSNEDQEWADLLSPRRRGLLRSGGGLVAAFAASVRRRPPPRQESVGYETYKEATIQRAQRPGEQTCRASRARTPTSRATTHIYFDEDSFHKAALLHKWAAERFEVELGNWNLEPRGRM